MAKSKNTNTVSKHKTAVVLENAKGEIVALGKDNFGIRRDDGGVMLLPVNLPADLKNNGVMIKFSGQIKETGHDEIKHGQPFVITVVEKI